MVNGHSICIKVTPLLVYRIFILSILTFMCGLRHCCYSVNVGEINWFSTQDKIRSVASPGYRPNYLGEGMKKRGEAPLKLPVMLNLGSKKVTRCVVKPTEKRESIVALTFLHSYSTFQLCHNLARFWK